MFLPTNEQNMSCLLNVYFHPWENAQSVRVIIFSVVGVETIQCLIHIVEVACVEMFGKREGVQSAGFGLGDHFSKVIDGEIRVFG
ncbi:hypothetical protein D3C76_1456950 [compost metagenome]